MKPKHVTVV